MKQILERFEAVKIEDWFSQVETQLEILARRELASDALCEMERYELDKDEYQWKASEIIKIDDIQQGNKAIEAALMNGIVAPVLVIDQPMTVRQLEDLLDEIPLNYTAINFEVNDSDLVKTFLSKLYRSRGLWTNLKGTFAIKNADDAELTRLIEQVNAVLPQFKLLSVDAQKHYQGKSQTVLELVNTLKNADEIFKKFTDRDLSENRIQQQMFVTFNMDKHIFTSIAKIKAFRQLWLKLAQKHHVAFPFSPAIHIRTLPHLDISDADERIIYTMIQAITGIFSEANQIILSVSEVDAKGDVKLMRAIHQGIKAAYEFPFFKKNTEPLTYINEMAEQLTTLAWQKFEATN